ncbi:MAG: hypothetical protein HYZ72_15805 [Deltaproteobacteria bacterium]|nr:hypothetical protein [Deltaproteobacteria bacterium]
MGEGRAPKGACHQLNPIQFHYSPARANGVHAVTWTVLPFRNLYDHHIPEWRHDNFYLRYAINIPLHEIQYAHAQAKRDLLEREEVCFR